MQDKAKTEMRIEPMVRSKYSQLRVLAGVVVLAGVLTGCAVKLVYNQLDWLIPWYLSDYLDMDGEQDAFFDKRLQEYLVWHRKSQLPEYAKFLRQVADDVEDGLSEQEVQGFQSEMEHMASVLMQRLAPDVTALFANADGHQLEELFEVLDKEGERFRRRYAKQSIQEQREDQVDDVIETIERWTGSLTKPQEALVVEWGKHYQLMGEEVYEAGVKWRTEFKQVLALRAQPELYQSRLYALLTTPDFGWSKAFRSKAEENKRSLSQLYFSLDKTFTRKQRKRIINTLLEYAEDFEQLAKED